MLDVASETNVWRQAHAAGLRWQDYLAAHRDRTAGWGGHLAAARLTEPQRTLLAGFTRRMPVIVLTGAWCGDCAVQCPMLGAIAEACPAADVRFLEQAAHMALAERVRICGGTRVPPQMRTRSASAMCAACSRKRTSAAGHASAIAPSIGHWTAQSPHQAPVSTITGMRRVKPARSVRCGSVSRAAARCPPQPAVRSRCAAR